MKILPSSLLSHIESEVTTLATCWKLHLRDGEIIGFTDHSKDMIIEEVLYRAESGITPGIVQSSCSIGIDNMNIEGVIDSDTIKTEDVVAGRFDFAELEVFAVNYQDSSQGKLLLKKGWLGEVVLVNNQFTAEVRGIGERTSAVIGDLYTPSCRVKFGDNSCKLNVELYTVSGTISTVNSNHVLIDDSRAEETGYFTAGKITFTSGLNEGISMEVKEYSTGGTIILTLPMPYTVSAGDGYSMIAGCNKSFATCVNRFDNAINFRGEPHVPGMDKMLATGG